MTAHREVLRSFSLSDTETSVEQNIWCSWPTMIALCTSGWLWRMLQMARLLDAEMQSVEHIIEEEQAHRAQVAALS